MKFADFFAAMALGRVDYVRVGGLAVSLQGVVRGRFDVGRGIDASDVALLARLRTP